MATVDAILFGFAGLAAAWLGYLLLLVSFGRNWKLVLLVFFYLLVAYLVLPRLHRVLTHLYLPGYFIGRARTSDGLLGDPVNIALLGEGAQIHEAMTAAGWTRADDVSLASGMRIVGTTLSRQSYAEAPVSPLRLFDRSQDFAYQQEVAGNPAKRHHVRFWRCPEGWMLPGGSPVGWLAAASYDRSVGLSLFTFQVTHRISQDVDAERDYTVASLTGGNPAASVDVIRHFSSGYHSRNGGGDAIVTDGDLPVVDVRSLRMPATPASVPQDRRDRRPPPTVFGAGVACARGLFSVVVALAVVFVPSSTRALRVESNAAPAVIASVLALVAAVDVGLGLGTFFGRNWARVLLMLISVVAIAGAFVAAVTGGPRPTLGAGLPEVSLSILVLLALTSHRARDYATRPRAPPPPSSGHPRDDPVSTTSDTT